MITRKNKDAVGFRIPESINEPKTSSHRALGGRMKTTLATATAGRDLDDEELEKMQRELTNWAIPIAKPNEFEASLRPSFFQHLPPLSVDEPAYSDIPKIFNRGGLTQSCPVKEMSYSRGVSDTIGNNYSPLARDLDVKTVAKEHPAKAQAKPSAYVRSNTKIQSSPNKIPALTRDRTQATVRVGGSTFISSKKQHLPLKHMSSDPILLIDENDDTKLPPLTGLPRAATFYSQKTEKAFWTRNRSETDAARHHLPPKHNDQVMACLSITFPPWNTSTVGLTRPNTPIDRDIPRFYHLVDRAIDPEVVAPLGEDWIGNILKLIPQKLQNNLRKMTQEILNEAKADYNRAIRISLLNYILLDPQEQKRLGVTALKKVPVSAEPPVYPWRATVVRIRSWMQNEFPSTMNIQQQIYQHSMTKYGHFKFFDMSSIEKEMPMALLEFTWVAQRSINNSVQLLNDEWLEECCQIVHEARDEIERGMPPGLPEIRQARLDKMFAGISSVMSLCLRHFMENTLKHFSNWLSDYADGNSYRGDFDLFSSKFQPVRTVPFVITMNSPTMVEGKRMYSITPGFQEFERHLHSLIDKLIESTQSLIRIEFRLFQVVEGLKIKYIRAIRDWETVVADVKARISNVIGANTAGPRRYKSIYDEFNFIIGDEAENHIARFLAKQKSLTDFGSEISRFQEINRRTDKLPLSIPFNFFQLDCSSMNAWLNAKTAGFTDQLIQCVLDKAVAACHAVCSQYDKITKRLISKLETTDDLVALQNYIENLHASELHRIKAELVRKAVEHVIFVYDYRLLEKEQLALITSTTNWPDKIKPMIAGVEERLGHLLDQAGNNLKIRRRTLTETMEAFAKRLKEFTHRDKVAEAEANCQDLADINKQLEAMIEEKKAINHEEVLLQCPEITPFNQLVQFQMRKDPYEKLWNLAQNFQRKAELWLNGPITAVNSGKVEEEVDALWREVYKLLKIFSRNDTKSPFKVAQNVKSKLEKFKRDLPLITAICNPGMKERHWLLIHKRIGIYIQLTEDITLTNIIQQGLEKYLPVLQEVSAQATVEFALEKAIVKMKSDWEGLRFEFVPYKNSGADILTGIDEIQTMLEDHALKTLAIKGSPYIAPFQTEIQEWQVKLDSMTAIMDSWVHVQTSWLYLVSIFSSENIRNQMPEEGQMFQEVDETWRGILEQSRSNAQALAILSQENILNRLKDAEKQLSTISRRLDDYLEGKRLFFPQFFFLSNDELLDILSEILNPLQVQPHLKKVFEGIHRLTFNEEKIIIGMESLHDEKIPFDEHINPEEAKGLVEVWLRQVEQNMRLTLRQKTEQALLNFKTSEMLEWLQAWPGQVCLTVSAIQWTGEVCQALKKNKLEPLLVHYREFLDFCAQYVREKLNESSALTSALRVTLTSLIVLGVHWRDVIGELGRKGCRDLDDFEWMAQMQYYFVEETKQVEVKMITARLPYYYEYIGNAQRLVVTPLTDRCHRTIMSAFNLNLGGALEGPAGTGKTETVKDLSKALAKQCVVFNCSDGVDYKVMAQFFKGLARLGAWACFDDFNRIHVEVLSVIAQQIQTIQRTIRERQTKLQFDGTTLELDFTCNVFITLNPGFSCRYELPDNLKVLFRTIAMVVPDHEMIAEISLHSMGFSQAKHLASKLVATYRLFSEQFSEQNHYDFGLRGIKSSLMAAGMFRTLDEAESDEQIILKSITDFNIPKLVPNDIPLFNGIIADLFPGVYSFPNVNPELLSTIETLLPKQHLQSIPYFVDKISQLYCMMLVRHGIIVIGDATCGKTTLLKSLAQALGETANEAPVRYRFVNPKSVTIQQLYGRNDIASREWIDGVLTKTFREHSRDSSSHRKWIVFDGLIDPVWAENINTVLDDNKKLCLVSGEVIGLTELQTILFECNSLVQASPSTVSRCGIIYMESSQLGYETVIGSWIQSQKFAPEHEKSVILLARWLIPACFAYIGRLNSHVIRCQPMHLVQSFLKLYSVLLKEVRGDDEDEENEALNHDENLNDEDFDQKMAEQMERRLEAQYQGLVCQFLFSLVWTIGGTLDQPSRAKFDEFFREVTEGSNPSYLKPPALRMQKSFCYPRTGGKIYDYYFDPKPTASEWFQWNMLIDPIAPAALFGDSKSRSTEILVQTVETVRQQFFLDKLLANRKPIIFVGPTGTGKTAVISNYLSKVDSNKYVSNTTTLLAKTGVNQLHDVIFLKLKKDREKGSYCPPDSKHMLLFVNDLGMPERDAFGSQPPLELIRHAIDHSFLFDPKDSALLPMDGFTVCGSLIPAASEHREISPRLLRHFNIVTIEPFSDEMIASIFAPILDYHFSRPGFGGPYKAYVPLLVKATLEVYKQAVASFLPTPQKCHYVFNLQDFSRVTKGLLMAKSSVFGGEEGRTKLTRLWVHEIYRVFYDRLADDSDRELFFSQVRDISQRILGEKFASIFAHLVKQKGVPVSDDDLRSLMFNDCMNTGEEGTEYDEVVDLDQAQEAMERSVEDYNAATKSPMPLVMFRFAIEHISRISRVLKQPGGHCLLIGMGGLGRQSLAKLATFIAGYELFEIEITKTFSFAEWRKGLRRLLRRAGDEGKNTVFLFTDHQIKKQKSFDYGEKIEDWFLEDIGVLLNSGDIPGIFEGEERKDIIENMQLLMSNEKTAVEWTPSQLYSVFVNRIRRHLHIVLCFSPIGEAFRNRVRRFPTLVSCCTLDWFKPWPGDAFEMVANRQLDSLEMASNVRTSMITLCDKIHKSVVALSDKFYQITRNRVYITPTYFLELLKMFKNLVEKRQYDLLTTKDRYLTGLEKIEASGKQIEVMRAELREIPPLLEKTTRETNELIRVIETETAQVEAKKAIVQADEAAANASAQEAQAIKEECEGALADALPALNAAIAALNTLNASHITVIKTMQKPPAGVRLVMEAVCVMKGIKPAKSKDENGKVVEDYWPEAKKMLSDMKFLETLREYDKDNIPPAIIKTIREKYVANPEFDPNNIKNISSACEGLCKWCRAMEQYDRVATTIAPRRKSLKIAEDQLAEQTAKLKEKRAEMKILEEKLAALKANYQAKVDEKRKLEANIDQCHLKIARAEKLISGLGGERVRWVALVENLTQTYDNIIGDALLAVATVTYLGAFSYEFRQQAVNEWMAKCRELAIPCSPSFNAIDVLGDPLTIREWRLNGLPVDNFSTENGVIVKNASRWPLIIDPQGQANRWIKTTERANRLAVVKMSDPSYLQTLETCIQFGTPCLLENVGEELDPVLEPLLLKAVFRQNSAEYIKLGDHQVEYSKDFRFYMTTRLRNPNYMPEIAIKVTLVNFRITPDALQHQMLGIVVALERPQLEEKKNSLIVEAAQNKRRLKDIESRTLEILSTSEGNILEDEEAIDLMASSEQLTQKISQEQEAAALTEQEIDQVRNGYKPVAIHSSTIYFAVSSLASINHMYQFRLTWFVKMFEKAIGEAPRSDNFEQRIAELNNHFTYSIFKSVSNSLFEQDKLLFPFLLGVNVQITAGRVDVNEWRFLLSGGYTIDNTSKNPAPEWISEKSWQEILRASALPNFDGLAEHVRHHLPAWQKFATKQDPIPEPWNTDWTDFQKLIAYRLFRPELCLAAVRKYVTAALGVSFVEPPTTDLAKSFEESTPSSPMIFILSPGSDPMAALYKLAADRGFTGSRLQTVSLGKGQGPIAERAISEGLTEGHWVVLQNCQLAPNWLSELERLSENIASDPSKAHPDFRLWLTTFPSNDFPVSILQNGVKIIDDSPKTLRANMMKTYLTNPLVSDQAIFESSKRPEVFKRLLFGLVFFHAVVQVRRKFGTLGWNVSYDFNDSDLNISANQLLSFVNDFPSKPPIETLSYLISQCYYGGRVTDDWDRRLMGSLFTKYFCEDVYSKTRYHLTESGLCYVPEGLEHSAFVEAIRAQPRFANPDFFGLHENANILRHKNEIAQIFSDVLKTMPREAISVTTKENKAQSASNKLIADILSKLPAEFRVEQVQSQYPVRYEEALNGVLIQEVARFNQLIATIKRSLQELQKAHLGKIVMPIELEEVAEALMLGRVPQLWLQKSYPSLKPLGSYFTDLLARIEFFKAWLLEGVPKVFWLSAFFFTQSFMTAVLQNHARRHQLSISDVGFEFEVLNSVRAEISKRPPTGAYVDGLFLDGAAWSRDKNVLVEAPPNVLYDAMPVIWLKPGENSRFLSKQVYNCPVYKTTSRSSLATAVEMSIGGGGNKTGAAEQNKSSSTAQQFIFACQLPINCSEEHWINRGVAMVCQLDN